MVGVEPQLPLEGLHVDVRRPHRVAVGLAVGEARGRGRRPGRSRRRGCAAARRASTSRPGSCQARSASSCSPSVVSTMSPSHLREYDGRHVAEGPVVEVGEAVHRVRGGGEVLGAAAADREGVGRHGEPVGRRLLGGHPRGRRRGCRRADSLSTSTSRVTGAQQRRQHPGQGAGLVATRSTAVVPGGRRCGRAPGPHGRRTRGDPRGWRCRRRRPALGARPTYRWSPRHPGRGSCDPAA